MPDESAVGGVGRRCGTVVTGWVQVVATSASSPDTGNWWEYLLLFLAVGASWAGVPAIGSAAVAAAAAGASQGNLNLAAVIVIASIAGEVGGLIGYRIGIHWGLQLLDRPGKRQAGRQNSWIGVRSPMQSGVAWPSPSPRRSSLAPREC